MVATARPSAGIPRAYHFPAFKTGTLESGARLIVCPVPKLPLATLLAVTSSGAATDPVGLEGIARLTAKLLVEGTALHSGAELSERLERLGASLETGADWDSSIARITFLTEHLDEVINVVGEVLLEPSFPERELMRLKAERIADVLQVESEPRALADEAFESFLFTPESRYAVQEGGSTGSVPRISRSEIVAFHSAAYVAPATTFIVAGDVSFDELRDKLSRRFSLQRQRISQNAPRRSSIASTSRRLRVLDKPDAPQSELRVGHGGLARNDPDYFPTVVMNAILGGLFGSRVNLNLREAHGYTYGASSYFDWRKDAGPFVISTAVATDVTAAALTEILVEVERIRRSAVDPLELSLAKDYLIGVFPIRYETTAAVSAALANAVIYDLPPDYYQTYRANIQAVTAEQVLDVSRRHLHPDALQTLIVGNRSAIRKSVEALGLGVLEAADRVPV
ncbi:MAG: insulinase family protein [Gemmatimonadota bacterium]|nr:insulinase family protein [Gemmatimonadota bacterium]